MPAKDKLNFQHLQYLQVLAEERSVTRAAERMGIGQSSMSTTLAKLRTMFKDPLLVATRKGMEPTPMALDIVRRSRDIIELLEGKGPGEAAFVPQDSDVHWKIMASDGIARAFLPDLMRGLDASAPRVRFTVQPGDPRQLLDYFRDGEFDLALTFVKNPAPELRQISLYPLRLVCIARQRHPQLTGRITLEQFITLPQVRWGAPPQSYATLEALVDERLAQLGHARNVRLNVVNLTALPEVVAKSNLIGVVPEQAVRPFAGKLQTYPLPFKVPVESVSMVWHEKHHRNSAHRWLRQQIVAVYRDAAPAGTSAAQAARPRSP